MLHPAETEVAEVTKLEIRITAANLAEPLRRFLRVEVLTDDGDTETMARALIEQMEMGY